MSNNHFHTSLLDEQRASDPKTFVCRNCGFDAPQRTPEGQARDHCPACIFARHDGASPDGDIGCGSRMKPIAIAALRTDDWIVIHRCVDCAALTSHPMAGDDNAFVLMQLAIRPLADPPFPLEAFGTL